MGIIDKAAQNFAQVVTRASEPFTPNVEIDPAEKAPFIAEKEVNFCVPQVLQELLAPALGELGFGINKVQLPGLPGTPPGEHNVIENRAGRRSMLHFPREVLTEPLVWQSIANVFQRFQLKDQTLLILSEGLESTHPFYVAVGQKVWQSSYRITAPFLPWTFLVPNPPHRSGGDFTLEDGTVGDGAGPRYTYAGIAVMSPAMVAGIAPEKKAPLAPLLYDAAARQLVGGELYRGMWQDVGTRERLAELEGHLASRRTER